MEKLKRKNKSWLIIIGSLIFLSGLFILVKDYYSNKQIENKEKQAISEYYNIEETVSTEEPEKEEVVKDQMKIHYIAILKIPKINLERGLVDPNSYLNNVNYNLEIVNGSDMPDVRNGNIIIAGHSGTARVSYFRNLDKLELGDYIIIDYNNNSYKYKIVEIYDIDKNRYAEINREKNSTIITLITCRHNTNKQIVIIGKLI